MAQHLFTCVSSILLMTWFSCATARCAEINDAARTGNLAGVKDLLKANPQLISSPAFDGWTPLEEAADNGYFSMAKFLVARGADVNLRGKGGRSPLFLAAMQDHRDIAKLLLTHGADANIKDDDGVTPLHLAAWNGNVDLAKLLLAHGADANSRDKNGETPADWAAERHDQKIEDLFRKIKPGAVEK